MSLKLLIWCATWVFSAHLKNFVKGGRGVKLPLLKKGSQSSMCVATLHFFLPIPQWVFMLILGLIALLARICYPMTIFFAKFRLFHQSFPLLRGQNLIFRLFTSKTLFVLQNPSFWCATWVCWISFNIFIKKGAGVYIDPLKKG